MKTEVFTFLNTMLILYMVSFSVIDDALCEQRLWDMKYMGMENFYMCEIRKDFTIDATFKGNASRFLNHSCDPNCSLEKWLVVLPSAFAGNLNKFSYFMCRNLVSVNN